MSNLSEEKQEVYKIGIEIGEIIGRYGTDKQIELFEKMLEDYKIKSSGYFKLQKENEELKSEKQFKIDTAEEVLKWKSKYHLLSRKINGVLEDKIKDKIKELEDKDYELHTRIILEDLLKE